MRKGPLAWNERTGGGAELTRRLPHKIGSYSHLLDTP